MNRLGGRRGWIYIYTHDIIKIAIEISQNTSDHHPRARRVRRSRSLAALANLGQRSGAIRGQKLQTYVDVVTHNV